MNFRTLAKTAQHRWRRATLQGGGVLRGVPTLRTALNLPRSESLDLASLSPADGRVRGVDPEQILERPRPGLARGAELPWEFAQQAVCRLPSTFVAELNRGRFWGHYGGAVFTASGVLIPELSKDVWGPNLHSAHARWRLPRLVPLPGRTLSLVTPEAASNYHHWTMDLLPRAGLAIRAGYRLQDFDHVLLNDRELPFQREGLARLGVNERQIIRVDEESHFTAETLVVPAIRLDNAAVSQADVAFVRELFLPDEPRPAAARRRLYLSRRDAAFRRVANENELQPLLQRYGFEELSMSTMSVAEQARTLSEAAVVLGPHGAASANLVFANRACRVIELMAPRWMVPYTWTTCTHLDLPYSVLVGRGERTPEGSQPQGLKDNIIVNVAELEEMLVMSGVTPMATG